MLQQYLLKILLPNLGLFKEINSTLAREISSGKVLLPIIYGSEEIIFKELPLLKDKLYKIWKDNPEELAKIIGEMLKKNQLNQII